MDFALIEQNLKEANIQPTMKLVPTSRLFA